MKRILSLPILLVVTLILFSCSKDDDFNNYEVTLTFSGEVSEFLQTLSIAGSRNVDGNFVDEPMKFKNGGIAPTFFTDLDFEAGSLSFETAEPTELIQLNYTNELFDDVETGSMGLVVVIKKDGNEIDNFSFNFDETTGREKFSVTYYGDGGGFRCYCAQRCNLLEEGDCN